MLPGQFRELHSSYIQFTPQVDFAQGPKDPGAYRSLGLYRAFCAKKQAFGPLVSRRFLIFFDCIYRPTFPLVK